MYYALPPSGRMLARKVFYLPVDLWSKATGKRHKYEPPQGDIYIGSGDFIAQGKSQLNLLKKHIDLSPTDRVLDVGCGIGRSAAALTEYINSKGSYEGFDVVEKGIAWCQKKITKDCPNFKFKYVPLNNDLYNTKPTSALDFVFPYSDNSFDKVFLFSVFTHMPLPEIEHYLSEIKRVLKPDGKCLSTFFMYDSKNEEYINNPKNAGFTFPVKENGYRLMDGKVISANVALDTSVLQKKSANLNLPISNKISGYWRHDVTKSDENIFQDIVVFEMAKG